MDLLEHDHWWFRAKRRFLRLALQRNGVVVSGNHLRALDVGCGTGAVLEELTALGFRAEGLDMSPVAQGFCEKKGLSVRLGDATALPFPDASFDVVTALDVIEHVDQDEKAIEEIYRVLKPGGTAIITVPAHAYLWSYHDVALHHKRRYSKSDFLQLVSRAGFSVHVGWIHAAILPGVFLVRTMNRLFLKEKKTSDVHQVSKTVSFFMKIPYAVEYILFRLWGTLPSGVSLIASIRRPV